MEPKFVRTRDGLEIIDRIERHRYRLTTHDSVSLEPVAVDRIRYPIDAAVEVTTDTLSLPTNETVYVRGEGGSMISEVRPSKQATVPDGAYTLDVSGPLKVYAHLEGTVHVYSDTEQTHVALDEPSDVVVGARSYHTRPAATVTTTADPRDVMAALSTFGSALKTTSPERSYPTLRGHPPALELGDELAVPDDITPPDTGVRIEIPPTLEHAFVVSPLAYYLGAEIVPGDRPVLATDRGFAYALDQDGTFEETVERALKRVFFLDCVVRTEGITPLPLAERRAVEPDLEFDLGDAYDQPLATRTETYFDVPYDVIEPHLLEWRLKTHVEPTDESVAFLPFVCNNLARVTSESASAPTADAGTETEAIADFLRGDPANATSAVRGRRSPQQAAARTTTVRQTWTSADSTDITSTAPLSAFRNSIGRVPKDDPIEIEAVCNDPEMREELEAVNGLYGNRDELPFEVTVRYGLSVEEFRDLLGTDVDFLHYIGHIDQDGIQCSDGKLDASDLESVSVRAFLLNACQSRDQGLHLVESGSIGGIVTLGDVVNSGADSIGRTVARLLNRGYPLYAALDIARKESVVGEQYLIVGDGTTTIAQSETEPPVACCIDVYDSEISIALKSYITPNSQRGSVFTPYLGENELYFLIPGSTNPISTTKQNFREFINLEDVPLIMNDTVIWTGDEFEE